MEKRIFSVLTAAVILIAATVLAVQAQAEGTYCDHCQQYVTEWTEWTATASGSHSQTTGGHYYLAKDFTGMSGRYGVNTGTEALVIDLRGHTIESTNNRCFFVSSGTLAIVDSVGGGVMVGARNGDGNLYVASGAQIDMYGGTARTSLTTIGSTGCGSVLYVLKGGIFNLYGGTLDGSAITTRAAMSGTSCIKGTLNMYGGTISGGNSTNGGNVYLDGGSLIMTGGTITGGQAVNGGNIYTKNMATVTVSCDTARGTVATVTGGHATSSSGLGGNLCITGGSTLNLTGGNITDGISDARGGNINNSSANTYNIVSGNLTGGKAGTDGANLFVNNASVVLNISGGTIDGGMDVRLTPSINLSGNPVITEESGGLVLSLGSTHAKINPGAFLEGASVCVSASGTFTDTLTYAEDFLQYIKPGSNALQISVSDSKLTAGVICPHCSETVEWTVWEDTLGSSHSRTTGGHFYLTANVSGTSRYKIDAGASGGDVVLDLRGYKITSTGDRLFYVTNGKLAIVDSVGTGVLKGARNGDGNIRIDGGQVDMYGGSIMTSRTEVASTGCGSIIYVANAAAGFNLYGGTLDGSAITTPAATSGTVYTKGAFHIYGGKVTGGNANNGGNIYVSSTGKLTMDGGTISDGKATSYGGNVYIVKGGSFTMTGGKIFGGFGDTNADEAYNGDNVYLGGTMVMSGGKIEAAVDTSRIITENDKLGNGILCWAGAYITLDGNAIVLNAEKSGNIYVGSTGGITVKKTFTGEASLAVVDYYHLSDPVLGSVMTGANDTAEGSYTGKLYLEGDYGYPRIYGLENGKLLVGGTASLNNAVGEPIGWYESAQEAADACSADTYVKLYADSSLALAANSSYILDLNGHDAVLSGSSAVMGFDSANADHETFGHITVAQGASVTVANGPTETFDQVYYTVHDAEGYSFHVIGMRITGISLRPSVGGMYYEGVWHCDSKLAAHLDCYGIAVSVYGMPETEEDLAKSLWTTFDGSSFVSGQQKYGAMVTGVMKTNAEASADRVAKNAEYGALPICAAAYAVIDGEYCFSGPEDQAAYSLRSLMEAIDTKITEDPENYGSYAEAMQTLFEKYPGMEEYTFTNFGPKVDSLSYILGNVLYETDFEQDTAGQLPAGWSAGYYGSTNAQTNTAFGWTGTGGTMTAQVVEYGDYGKVYQFGSSNADAFTAMPAVGTLSYLYEAKLYVMRKGTFGLANNFYAPTNEADGVMFTSMYPDTQDPCRYTYKGKPSNSTNQWNSSVNPAVGAVIDLQILSLNGKNYILLDDRIMAVCDSRAGAGTVDYPGIYTCGGSVYVLEAKVTEVLSAQIQVASAELAVSADSTTSVSMEVTFDKTQPAYQMYVGGDYTYSADSLVKFGAIVLVADSDVSGFVNKDTQGALEVIFTNENISQTADMLHFTIGQPLPAALYEKWYNIRPFVLAGGKYLYGEAKAYSPVNLANGAYLSAADDAEKARIEALFGNYPGFIVGEDQKELTFTLFSDFHYKAGMYPATIADLRTILQRADNSNSAFVLSAGDFTNDAKGSPELFNTYLNYFTGEGSLLPAYNIYGNHELEAGNTMADVSSQLTNDSSVVWGSADGKADVNIGYYYFEKEGFRIICLDSEYSFNPTTGAWEHNKTGSSSWPSGNILGGSLGPQQLAWLENVLMDAASKGIPCIVVAHDGFSGLGWATTSPDAEAIRGLYAKANKSNPGTVLMSINGHIHTNHQGWNDGVFYFDTNTTRNTWWQETAVDHYSDEHTFIYEEYDDEGNLLSTYAKSYNTLTMGAKTWFSADPLSCVITISEAGVVSVDGMQSEWAYGIVPDAAGSVSGVMPEISSGTFWDCDRYGHILTSDDTCANAQCDHAEG